MPIVLFTNRLRLRPAVPADAADLHALEQDGEVMRFLNGGKPTPLVPPEVAPFRMPRGYDPDVWAAIAKADGGFVGWFSLGLSDGKVGSLGYRLRREAWGRGLATEGAEALVDLGFIDLSLSRIVAETMAVNLPSRRVLEKLGMSLVRTIHHDWPDALPGSEEGEVEYALTYEDFRARITKRSQS